MTMTPQEEAQRLVKLYAPNCIGWANPDLMPREDTREYHAIQCALICVDEILKAVPYGVGNKLEQTQMEGIIESDKYWQAVKAALNEMV